jgi:hypothetical protein
MSVIPPLSGDKQTFGERAKNDASHPKRLRNALFSPGSVRTSCTEFGVTPNASLNSIPRSVNHVSFPFMPDGRDPAAGFPAMTSNVSFLMKDVVLLAGRGARHATMGG